MERRLSDRLSLRTIMVGLVLALAMVLAALSSGFGRPAATRPAAPPSTTIRAPSALNDIVRLERAEDGSKQCQEPHEIVGPQC